MARPSAHISLSCNASPCMRNTVIRWACNQNWLTAFLSLLNFHSVNIGVCFYSMVSDCQCNRYPCPCEGTTTPPPTSPSTTPPTTTPPPTTPPTTTPPTTTPPTTTPPTTTPPTTTPPPTTPSRRRVTSPPTTPSPPTTIPSKYTVNLLHLWTKNYSVPLHLAWMHYNYREIIIYQGLYEHYRLLSGIRNSHVSVYSIQDNCHYTMLVFQHHISLLQSITKHKEVRTPFWNKTPRIEVIGLLSTHYTSTSFVHAAASKANAANGVSSHFLGSFSDLVVRYRL